jgi:hypothetical protein
MPIPFVVPDVGAVRLTVKLPLIGRPEYRR